MLPALAKAKAKAQGIGCLSNTKQLTLAWHLYFDDFNDRVANNYGVDQTTAAITSGLFDNWVNNVMAWGASGATDDKQRHEQGVGGQWRAGPLHRLAIGVYKCPADNFLSPAQRNAG